MKIHVIYSGKNGSLKGTSYSLADCYDYEMIVNFININRNKDAISCQWFSDKKSLTGRLDFK